jgi:hypothetical protein
MAFASLIAVFDIVLALVGFLANPNVLVLYTASNFLLLEFAILLIMGGCMAAREPLQDEDKYDEDGTPSTGHRMASIGKKMLLTSVFVLLYGALFVLFGWVF